tara:strand:- start:260 stop:463 length:204 start_codon:yes stop_codon:yes gene_type:complete
MAKKKKGRIRTRNVEVVNITTRKRKMINLDDEWVVFDEKTGMHQVLPIKKATYEIDDTKEEEKEEIL